MSKEKSEKKLLNELLKKGYGEDERKKWREKYRKNLMAKMNMNKKKTNEQHDQSYFNNKGKEEKKQKKENKSLDKKSPAKQKPGFKGLSPKLRRQIDSYAFKNKYLITTFKERFLSMLTILNPAIGDYANEQMVKTLSIGKGFLVEKPEKFCLYDNLEALHFTSGYLLGKNRPYRYIAQKKEKQQKAEALAQDIKQKIPAAYQLLTYFQNREESVYQALLKLRAALEVKNKIVVYRLTPVVKYIFKTSIITGNLNPGKLDTILNILKELNKQYETNPDNYKKIETNSMIFKTAYLNLAEFQHQLFPTLLKLLGKFFKEDEITKQEYLDEIIKYVGLNKENIISFNHIKAASTFQAPPASKARADQPDIPPKPKIEFNQLFSNTLKTLKILFPGSNIANIDKWEYILPYFDRKIFSKVLPFPEDIQHISRTDPMGQIMVLHRIIDNMLSSTNYYELDAIFNKKDELQKKLTDMVKDWQQVYTHLFTPYIHDIHDYVKNVSLVPVNIRRKTPLGRKIEEGMNQIKNQAIRHYGKIIVGLKVPKALSSLKIYKLVENVYFTLKDLHEKLSLTSVKGKNPAALELYETLRERKIIDYEVNIYKPVIKAIQSFIESHYKEKIENIPQESQLAFFEILMGCLSLYNFLLNHKDSYYKHSETDSIIAGKYEQRIWERIKAETSEFNEEML